MQFFLKKDAATKKIVEYLYQVSIKQSSHE